jgi:hypothetical protein
MGVLIMPNGYGQFTPEMIKMLTEYGLIPQLQSMNKMESEEANRLKETPLPDSINIGYDKFGSVSRQPSILEGLDVGLKRLSGYLGDKQAKDAMMANILRQRDISSEFANKYAQSQVSEEQAAAAKAQYDAAGKDPMMDSIKQYAQQPEQQAQNAIVEMLRGKFDPENPDFSMYEEQPASNKPQLAPAPAYSLESGGAPPPSTGRGNVIPPLYNEPQPEDPNAGIPFLPVRKPVYPPPPYAGWRRSGGR